jgi:Putative auto-transporter adhesin, head GIN domain
MRAPNTILLSGLLAMTTLAPPAHATQTLRLGNSVTITDGVSIVNGKVVSGSGDFVQGSGKVGRETRSLESFSAIELSISADVTVTKGATPACTISADDNILPIITTQVSGGVLTISQSKSYSSSSAIRIQVTTPSLSRLVLDGSGDVVLSGIDERHLKLVASGSGSIRASGRVEALEARLEGAGDMGLFDLEAGSAQVTLDGSGDIHVSAHDTFSGVIQGSGDIVVRGHPRMLRSEVNGAGEIVQE